MDSGGVERDDASFLVATTFVGILYIALDSYRSTPPTVMAHATRAMQTEKTVIVGKRLQTDIPLVASAAP